MFSKRCSNCGNKVKSNYEFCPYCSMNLKTEFDRDDFGFLGKNDLTNINLPSTHDSFIEKMFDNAMKLLERQMKNIQKDYIRENKIPHREFSNLNIQFFVNGKRIFPEKTVVHQNKPIKINNQIIQEKFRNLLHLPKKEPKTRLKRLAGRLIYELVLPGVKSIENILINQLENSIEIKAISDKQIYHKNLKINLPVTRYALKNEILFIELQPFIS